MRILRVLAFLLLALGFHSVAVAAEPPSLTLDEIIDRNAKAMGGREKIESLQSVEIQLHVKDPGFEVDGVYKAARPGRMRIDIMADGKRVYAERFDGEKAWQWQEGKEEKEEGATPSAALRHGVELSGNLFGLHELQKRGHKIELTGRQSIQSVEYYVLNVTLNDGYQVLLLWDPLESTCRHASLSIL